MLALTLLSAQTITPRQVGGNTGDNVRREHGIIFEALRLELTGLTFPRPPRNVVLLGEIQAVSTAREKFAKCECVAEMNLVRGKCAYL